MCCLGGPLCPLKALYLRFLFKNAAVCLKQTRSHTYEHDIPAGSSVMLSETLGIWCLHSPEDRSHVLKWRVVDFSTLLLKNLYCCVLLLEPCTNTSPNVPSMHEATGQSSAASKIFSWKKKKKLKEAPQEFLSVWSSVFYRRFNPL